MENEIFPDEIIELSPIELLDGPDYVDYEYWDETSMFDDHPTTRWVHGAEYYERRYRCRVPGNLSEDTIDDWIYNNLDGIKWLE